MEPKHNQNSNFVQKRQEYTKSIRRQNRQDLISKRRNLGQNQHHNQINQNDREGEKINYVVDERYQEYIKKFQKTKFYLEGLSELVRAVNDKDIIQQHYGVIGIRKIMSLAEQPPIQVIIDFGVVPRLIELVSQDQYPQLQLQSTWALANVASGTPQQCQSIIDKGAIQLFIKLLRSRYPGIAQQAIWALGNIASDSSFNRDAIIRKGGIPNFIYVLQTTKCVDLIQPGAWALSNLCRGTPLPNFQLTRQGVLTIGNLIAKDKIKQQNTFADCCWSISFGFPKAKQDYQKLINKQLIFQIVSKLNNNESVSMIVPIVRILGHITKINNYYVDLVLEAPGIVESLCQLLSFEKKTIRMQTLWAISNIMSGPQRHIDTLLANQLLIAKILELFEIDSNEIKRQITCLFANMVTQGNHHNVFRFFTSVRILRYYVEALTTKDPKLIIDALDNMFPILTLGQKFKQPNQQNPFVSDLISLGALSIFEQLQLHQQQGVYQSVVKIMKQFFQMQENINF